MIALLLLADIGLGRKKQNKLKCKRRNYKTVQPSSLYQLRGKKTCIAFRRSSHLNILKGLIKVCWCMYLKTLYFSLRAVRSSSLCNGLPGRLRGRKRISFRKRACWPSAAPLPGPLPEGAAQIHLDVTATSAWESWQKSVLYRVDLAVRNAYVGVCSPSLSCGMGYVQCLSLSYLLLGFEALNL